MTLLPYSAEYRYVFDRFDTGHATLYDAQTIWATDCEGLP